MYVDSHAHLEGSKFDSDRDQVLTRARDEGVEKILLIGSGTGPGTYDCAIKIAEQQHTSAPELFATLGVHPHEANLVGESDYAEMEALAKNPKIIAWGEIGLDYYYDHSPRDVQKKVFTRQMELARTAKLPIIIHCRPSENSENAWDDSLALIREHWAGLGIGGVLHCFTGELHHMNSALDMGFMISFAGNVTFPKALNIREAAKRCPLDRMFIETDSPFLAPVPHRGKRNEPAFVTETARHIAEVRGIAVDELAATTTANFNGFFSLKN
jgi:TatD DNase family protein